MLFFEDRQLSEQELDSLKNDAINNFKLGVKRINAGENPKMVGEFSSAIRDFTNFQEASSISDQDMIKILEDNKISISNLGVKSAIERSFVFAFGNAIEVCEWYKKIMNLDITDDILKETQDIFINNLKYGYYDYERMIRLMEFEEEFLLSKEVREAAETELLRMIERGELDKLNAFIEVFKLEDFLLSKEVREAAEKKFIDLFFKKELEEALRIAEMFDLKDAKELSKDFKRFCSKINEQENLNSNPRAKTKMN